MNIYNISNFIQTCQWPFNEDGWMLSHCSAHITFFCLFTYCLIAYSYFIISCNLAWLYFLYYSIRLIHIRLRDPLYTPRCTQSLLSFVCTHITCAWHRQCNYSLYPRTVQRHGVESLTSSRVVCRVSARSSSPSKFPWTLICHIITDFLGLV